MEDVSELQVKKRKWTKEKEASESEVETLRTSTYRNFDYAEATLVAILEVLVHQVQGRRLKAARKLLTAHARMRLDNLLERGLQPRVGSTHPICVETRNVRYLIKRTKYLK